MKKEIIINASKDRSRIAIVEDGELVELYVENPDNVRTIGNIYLGGVQKVMPAIRAAFVNVGQKQDAFLHFSDLTDNAAQLFALAGEDVPGLEAPVLSQAPPKRVGDDESEPDPEEALEIASGEEDDKPVSRTRSRSRRRSRGRGRGRGRGKEEEEEQEEGKKGLPSVIDLTSPAPKRAPRNPKTDDASSKADGASSKAVTPEPDDRDSGSDDEAPKRSRRSRSRKKNTDGGATSDADEKATDETSEDKPRRSRRSRGKKSDASTPDDASSTDTKASEETSERPKRTRRRSRSDNAGSSDAAASTEDSDAPQAGSKTDADAKAEEKPRTRSRKPRRSNTIDLTSPAPSRSRTRPSDEEDKKDDDAPRGRAGDSDEEGSSSRRRGRSSDDSSSDSGESSGRSRRGRAGDSDGGDDSGRSRRGRRKRSDDASGDDQKESASRGRSRDDRSKDDDSRDDDSKDDSGRSRRGRRSRSDDASSKGDESSSRDDGDNGRSGRGSDRSKDSSGSRDSGRGRSGRTSSGRGGRGGSPRGGSSANANVPSAESLLKRGTRVICKITKEPISTKGPRVSTDISLAGRFLVLVPAADYIAVSKKIESAKERRRLRTLAQSLKPDGFGVIVRTVASGRDAKSLDTDLRLLLDKWNKIQRKLDEGPEPPVLLYEDVNMVSSIIRDLFSEDYDRIVVDDPRVHRNVQAYVKAVAPQMLDKVELHRKNQPVYRSYGIERQVEEAFSRRVNMKGGGYLFIETTEAMHVVDVNSGRAGRGKSQKENLIAVNVEAAREIAKQLRLRDLGGIIVVDFIDLRYDRDRRKVTDALKEAFKKDRAVTKLLPMSDFGLVQITRQRLRPSITANTDEGTDGADAARSAGAAEIRQPERDYAPEPEPAPTPVAPVATERVAVDPEQATPEALTQSVRGWLDRYRGQVDEKYKGRPIVVRVHPLLGAYLRRGFPTPLTRWKLTLRGISFRVEDDAAIDPLGFDVRDEKSGRSLLSKYSS